MISANLHKLRSRKAAADCGIVVVQLLENYASIVYKWQEFDTI